LSISNRGIPDIISGKGEMKRSRLVIAILATLGEEIAMALFILLGLPRLGVEVPLGGLIGMMAGLATYGVISYRLGSRALMKKPMAGFTDMVGSRGTVMEPLTPRGTIKIRGELWDAEATEHHIERGQHVIVVSRDGLKLMVREVSPEAE
jgi:membrane protein implicated in regulation of membrane protease activity